MLAKRNLAVSPGSWGRWGNRVACLMGGILSRTWNDSKIELLVDPLDRRAIILKVLLLPGFVRLVLAATIGVPRHGVDVGTALVVRADARVCYPLGHARDYEAMEMLATSSL